MLLIVLCESNLTDDINTSTLFSRVERWWRGERKAGRGGGEVCTHFVYRWKLQLKVSDRINEKDEKKEGQTLPLLLAVWY